MRGVCCKQKTAYEMRISDWGSDVCSSDLIRRKEPPDNNFKLFHSNNSLSSNLFPSAHAEKLEHKHTHQDMQAEKFPGLFKPGLAGFHCLGNVLMIVLKAPGLLFRFKPNTIDKVAHQAYLDQPIIITSACRHNETKSH